MVSPKNQPKRCVCGEPSLKGLSGTNPPCAYAWARDTWGEAWANEQHPNHPHRRRKVYAPPSVCTATTGAGPCLLAANHEGDHEPA